jgi:thiamine biosynthesis protein ThiS
MTAEALNIVLNGQKRSFPDLRAGATLQMLVESLGLKPDRIAVELDGEIAARAAWGSTTIGDGGRVEIVHFVGGGTRIDS